MALYTGIIALALYGFFLYQFCYLVKNNIASNEEIRGRWNGHPRNESEARHYKNDVGCGEKFWHFMYGPMPPSKLDKMCRLIEINETLSSMRGPSSEATSKISSQLHNGKSGDGEMEQPLMPSNGRSATL